VTGADGGPIRVQDARVRISVLGVTQAGESVMLSPPVGADGRWEAQLPPGQYRAQATLEFGWNGSAYRVDLHPLQDNTRDRPAADGLVNDFEWRLSGLRPGAVEDPAKTTSWYGGAVTMGFEFYREDLKQPCSRSSRAGRWPTAARPRPSPTSASSTPARRGS
jgi:hypothetical protein